MLMLLDLALMMTTMMVMLMLVVLLSGLTLFDTGKKSVSQMTVGLISELHQLIVIFR